MGLSNGQKSFLTLVCLLTAVGLTPGGSSTVHIYTQKIHRTTQLTNWEECGPCPVFASYTLAFALHMREKYGETSVRVAEERQLALKPKNARWHKPKNASWHQSRRMPVGTKVEECQFSLMMANVTPKHVEEIQ